MTKFIAHRGYARFERENTLPAFLNAAKNPSVYGMETDIHITTDGVYVISHDANLSRVSEGKLDMNVEEVTYAEVSKVRLPGLDGTVRDDLSIPKAIDYFKVCKEYGKIAVCELKQGFTKEQISEVYKIVKDLGMIDNTVFISFNIDNLIKMRELDDKVKIQWLFSEMKLEYYDILTKYHFGIDINQSGINLELIKKCQELGIETNAWTVNDVDTARKFVSMGIDYITSDWINEKDL